MADASLCGPGRTLAIRDCFDCPMSAVRPGGFGALVCKAADHIKADLQGNRPIPLGPDNWSSPPPDWCPLRGGPLTLEVRP